MTHSKPPPCLRSCGLQHVPQDAGKVPCITLAALHTDKGVTVAAPDRLATDDALAIRHHATAFQPPPLTIGKGLANLDGTWMRRCTCSPLLLEISRTHTWAVLHP